MTRQSQQRKDKTKVEVVEQIEVLEETSRAYFIDAQVKVEWQKRFLPGWREMCKALLELKYKFVCRVKLLLSFLLSFKISSSISLVHKGKVLEPDK